MGKVRWDLECFHQFILEFVGSSDGKRPICTWARPTKVEALRATEIWSYTGLALVIRDDEGIGITRSNDKDLGIGQACGAFGLESTFGVLRFWACGWAE